MGLERAIETGPRRPQRRFMPAQKILQLRRGLGESVLHFFGPQARKAGVPLQIRAGGVDNRNIMIEKLDDSRTQSPIDDPRKLTALLSRIADLAKSHSVGSVVIGLAAPQGDRMFPELMDFLQSQRRVV